MLTLFHISLLLLLLTKQNTYCILRPKALIKRLLCVPPNTLQTRTDNETMGSVPLCGCFTCHYSPALSLRGCLCISPPPCCIPCGYFVILCGIFFFASLFWVTVHNPFSKGKIIFLFLFLQSV